MPLVYQPAGTPGTHLGEAKLSREALEKISANIEKQNEILKQILETLSKNKKK
ncbi:hypothetical protein IKG31_00290 [Candidatus Saccharibacteria bacterium]|jgi:hypothetical protein|nr:hypothetical protein [Candidatus Saccharibacteria bacterium]